MQIILLHPRFNAKSVTLTHWHLLFAALAFIIAVIASASLLYYFTFRHATELDIPLVKEALASATQDDTDKKDRYVRENLTAMAMKLGEMQAQLMRLDALGERVQGLAGVKPQEFNFKELPGRGGAAPSGIKEKPLSMNEFQQLLETTAKDVEHRADYMNVVETTLMSQKIRSKLLPTTQPVNVSYNASGFGWRLDPFNGRSAFHEGIDFAAAPGTPIVAAAGGVVIAAEYHHQFGNMLEIDHGNDMVTRYAHASRLHAKLGDIVKRGQHVADIGSTGRSTGAHLHFEVLVKGVQQDPHKFLAAGADQAKLAALASKD
ncbi:M23 family metallopeptidase [Noviherbaspirillum sp. CPCC 100848]|uniref:M23 family metallopeptidase n=1 Tax=Noviherbaspirillum album TaxID=3080276 RepID=A0ABU6J6C7_9BURK|nr:M23 family metallopeptidase [Noviherbaspirillum sp. CPCC 100848]MEC4719197.1 M23 family metallopeptidase [Noviherbaspirillum sp. CPCC 100848]